MSQENVEIVRRLYGFWLDRDFSTIADFVNPDVVLDLSRNVFNPGVHRGLDGFRRFLEEIDETWEDFRITPEEFVDAGNDVFVAYRISGKGRGSGVEANMRVFGVWTLHGGKVSRFAGGYRDRTEALEAAGLEE
jgi:ketosteroid isomerase-like protein